MLLSLLSFCMLFSHGLQKKGENFWKNICKQNMFQFRCWAYYHSRLHRIFPEVLLSHESCLCLLFVYCNRAIMHLQVALSVTDLYLRVSYTLHQVHSGVHSRWINRERVCVYMCACVCVYTLNRTFIQLLTQYRVDKYWKSSQRAHWVFTGQCNWMAIYCLLGFTFFITYHNTSGISNIQHQTPWKYQQPCVLQHTVTHQHPLSSSKSSWSKRHDVKQTHSKTYKQDQTSFCVKYQQ